MTYGLSALLLCLPWLQSCAPRQGGLPDPQSTTSQSIIPTEPAPSAQRPVAATLSSAQTALFSGTYLVVGDAQAPATPQKLTLLLTPGDPAVHGTLETSQGRLPLSGTYTATGPEQARLSLSAPQPAAFTLQREGQQVTLEGEYVLAGNAQHLYSYKSLTPGEAVAPSLPAVSPPVQTAPSRSAPLPAAPAASTERSIPVFVTPTPGPLPK